MGIGAIIGAGVSMLGGIAGSIMSANAARRAERARQAALDKQETRATNLYNYEMGMPRYVADRYLQKTADQMAKRKAQAEAKRNVVGGTQASVQGEVDAETEAMGNAAQDAIAQGLEGRRETARNYANTMNSIDAQRAQVSAENDMAKANATAQAVQGVTQAAGNIATAIDSGGTKAKNGGVAYTPKIDTKMNTKLSSGKLGTEIMQENMTKKAMGDVEELTKPSLIPSYTASKYVGRM